MGRRRENDKYVRQHIWPDFSGTVELLHILLIVDMREFLDGIGQIVDLGNVD